MTDVAQTWTQTYDACLDALATLAEGLTAEQLALTVPATPKWTVRTVIAHLAGVSCDNVSGRMDGAPSAEWTARHVAERSAVPVPHLVAELRSHRDALVRLAQEATVPAMVWDISVHLADLHEALGLGRPPEPLWRAVHDAARPRLLADVTISGVDDYEVFRGMFSRRSRAQVSEWDGVDGQVDEIGAFGPRDDDQPRPA